MRRQISEKTLELNVTAEILQQLRSYSGLQNIFWQGMTQRQEAKNGIDETLRNSPGGRFLALQFKSPHARRPNRLPYIFTINERQHLKLLRLARKRPNSVYYVFPHYNTFSKLGNDVPRLTSDTWLLRVADVRRLNQSSNRRGTHKVESYGCPPNALGHVYIHSTPINAPTISCHKLIYKVSHGDIRESLINGPFLKEWLETIEREYEGKPSIRGQLFRGFSTIFVNDRG